MTVRENPRTTQVTSLSVASKSKAMTGKARMVMLMLITMVTNDNATARNAFHL